MSRNQATWRIWTEAPRATINPNIYGHFAEHLGRCIYEGIWVGPESKIPNEDGFRLDTMRALRNLPTPVVRWPGGCFADDYHWEDAIGPVETRKPWRNGWWYGGESNRFGTDEFLAFSQKIGAQPYISANVGSGSPTEASSWVEYCNATSDTRYANLRAANGHAAPYNVKYWGVGNETWGCGGNYTPEEYAHEYRRYATYMRMMDRTVELIAVGDNVEGHRGPGWNQRFFEALGAHQHARTRNLINHISIHRYFRPANDLEFTDAEYYDLNQRSLQLEEDIRLTADVLSYYCGRENRIGIIVDEWGTWYVQASKEARLEQKSTMQDAVIAGATLNMFNHWADWVTMANIAQTINVLQAIIQTDEEKFWLTPTYHAFKLFTPHMGQLALRDEFETPAYDVPQLDGRTKPLPLVSTSASRSADGRTLHLTLVNRDLADDFEVKVSLHDGAQVAEGTLTVLDGDGVRAFNSADSPERVAPRSQLFAARGSEFAVTVPAHSVSALSLTLA